MKWYHYLACFFAGAFIANTLPHLLTGVAGNRFPSPFADPPGKGLSSPLVNVLWGFGNLVVGYLLMRVGKVSESRYSSLFVFFLGFALMCIQLSIVFVDKHPG